MKKVILILSTVSILLIACSKSDSASPIEQPKILVKKIIETNTQTGATLTYVCQYVGNKIIKTISTDSSGSITTETFTYTGDLITKRQSGTSTDDYVYDTNNRLISQIHTDNSYVMHYNYTYNSDATVTENGERRIYFTAEGDISRIKSYDSNGQTTQDRTYTYDNSNNPFKNITGNTSLIKYSNPVFSLGRDVVHNITSGTTWISGTGSYPWQATYTYNSEGYPLTSVSGDYTLQYFY